MSNRYQKNVKENPIPYKTFVPNSVIWTSVEEMEYYVGKSVKLHTTKYAKKERNL